MDPYEGYGEGSSLPRLPFSHPVLEGGALPLPNPAESWLVSDLNTLSPLKKLITNVWHNNQSYLTHKLKSGLVTRENPGRRSHWGAMDLGPISLNTLHCASSRPLTFLSLSVQESTVLSSEYNEATEMRIFTVWPSSPTWSYSFLISFSPKKMDCLSIFKTFKQERNEDSWIENYHSKLTSSC